MEELERFPQMHRFNAKDLERLADLLDVAVVNLKDAGRSLELGNGIFYARLLTKLSKSMLAQYQRWLYEHRAPEQVESLLEWLNLEAEFQTTATEVVDGLSKVSTSQSQGMRHRNEHRGHTFLGTKSEQTARSACLECKENHSLHECDVFKAISVSDRWVKAKAWYLCYRCLSSGHRGNECRRGRICGIDDCKNNHHRLLHDSKKSSESRPKSNIQETHLATEASFQATGPTVQALRTVPVVLHSGTKSITINALLDDGSTQTYLNTAIADELGLENSNTLPLSVNGLNGQTQVLQSSSVLVELTSIDKSYTTTVTAQTLDRAAGNLEAVNWHKVQQEWAHLKDVRFPEMTNTHIDMLIGVDHAELHCSLAEIRGQQGEPIARLTKLGWTCVGVTTPSTLSNPKRAAFLAHSFVTCPSKADIELSNLVQQFWEIDQPPQGVSCSNITAQEEQAYTTARATIKQTNGRYSIGIPWRDSNNSLPDSYNNAVRRLLCTEKRLIREPLVGESYMAVIQEYLSKGYIRLVDDEPEPGKGWYLPHFPIVKPSSTTTKTRIVFDASAKVEGVSLNDAIHTGPKLQGDLFEILVRFRKESVALVCDITQMYL